MPSGCESATCRPDGSGRRKPRPKRQIGLRWPWWLACAALAGCAAPAGHPDETAAVAAIRQLGGKVEFDGDGPDRRVVKVYLHHTEVQDDDLAELVKLPKLRNLFLGKTDIGDAGLEHLRQSSELETLSLNSTHVTDQGLQSLIGLKQLKTLNVQETSVTAAGAALLRKKLPRVVIAR